MENYTVIDDKVIEAKEEAVKKIRLTPEDFDRLKGKAVKEEVSFDLEDTILNEEEPAEFKYEEPVVEIEEPVVDETPVEEVTEEVVEAETEPDFSYDTPVYENFEPAEEVYEEEVPVVEEVKDEVEEEPYVPFEEKEVSPWKEPGEATYKVPDIPSSNLSAAYVSATGVNSDEYYKKLSESGTLSKTASEVLDRRLEQIDSIDSDLDALRQEKDKAIDTINKLQSEKEIRTAGKDQISDFIESVSKLDEAGLNEAAEKANVDLENEMKEFKKVIEKFASKVEEVEKNITRIDEDKTKEESISEALSEQEGKMEEDKKDILSKLPEELKSAADIDDLAEQQAQIEADTKRRIEELKAQREALSKTLPMFTEKEEPKQVVNVENKFEAVRESEGYAKAA